MYKVLFFVFILIIIGCQTTGDPKQGGLFGWSEDKAKGRQEELKGTLGQEEAEGQTLKAGSQELENEKAMKSAELAEQQKKLSALEYELDDIRKKISSADANTAVEAKQKKKAEDELARLKKEINDIKNSKQLSIQEKKKKIDMLNNDVNDLMRMITAL